jgi:hypothetical protein
MPPIPVINRGNPSMSDVESLLITMMERTGRA